MRYERAVQEAFYWAEKLDNGQSFADFGEVPSPGIEAALSGFWRGRNRADNESVKNTVDSAAERKQKEENRRRYVNE